MSAVGNEPIKYSELFTDISANIRSHLANVGSAYKDGTPASLQYPYTTTIQNEFPTDGRGYKPRVVWSNSDKIALVSDAQFDSDLSTYLTSVNVVPTAEDNNLITLASAVKFLTAVLTFETSKIAMVYNHFTTYVDSFYIPSNPIVPAVTDTSDIGVLLAKITYAATNPTRGFCSTTGFVQYGN